MNRDVLNLIERLGEKESKISEKEIVSPVFYNRKIATQIEKITYLFDIPEIAPGWHKFQPIDLKIAKHIGPANFIETESYLKCLPKFRVILVYKKGPVYYGVPIKGNSFGFKVTELLPIYLTDDMAIDFSKCLCRFDGVNLWYQEMDISGDFSKVDYLMESLKNLKDPKHVRYPGLSIEEKIAYSLKLNIDIKFNEELKKTKIQRDVEHAGGTFIESKEKSDHIIVTYKVDGKPYTSYVTKEVNHKIITAGICLNGSDRNFDLKSLVSVIREGQNSDLIYRTM